MDQAKIKYLVNEISAATRKVQLEIDNNNFQRTKDLEDLISAARQLISVAEDPKDVADSLINKSLSFFGIKAAVGLGLFDAFPSRDAQVSIFELATKTQGELEIVTRLMRILTAAGIFEEVSEGLFKHNKASQALTYDSSGLFLVWFDVFWKAAAGYPEYLERTGYGMKDDPDGFKIPLAFAFNMKVENLYQYLEHLPQGKKDIFNRAMTDYPLDLHLEPSIISLFENDLAKGRTEAEVILCDIGGGYGHMADAIRTKCQGLKGRFIVQDLASSVPSVDQKKEGIEYLAYDFFTPQPVEGAFAYFICRVLHNWSDECCVKILSNQALAMDAQVSRILIGEYILPSKGASVFPASMDLAMSLFGGKLRTVSKWREILDLSGLKLTNIWDQGEHSLLEARLK